jgi:hypothetical protein
MDKGEDKNKKQKKKTRNLKRHPGVAKKRPPKSMQL